MYKIELNLPVVGTVFLSIKDKQLFIFSKRQLKNYIVNIFTDNTNVDFVTIDTSIDKKFKDIILGRQVKFKDNRFDFSINSKVQRIKYKYNFNANLTINISFKKKIFYILKSLIKSNYSMNHILFYQTILYPIFSLYSLVDNYYLVHGSLIKMKDKHIVLTGLDGVGKSSLSNELALNNAKILADNFVLFNGEKFIGISMPIRLDLDNETKENIVFQDNNLKEILFEYNEFKAVKVDNIYFLSIGNEFILKEIDKNLALYNWSLINNGAGEILDANLFNMPFIYQNIFEKSILLNKNEKYFQLTIPKGKIKEALKEFTCQ